MTPDEATARINELIITSVNAAFDCGAWDEEDGTTCKALLEKSIQARQALNAAISAALCSQRPRWSKERPTVAGWYWMRRMDIPTNPFGIMRVRHNGSIIDYYIGGMWESASAFSGRMQCEWAGPLPMPEEGP